MIVRTMERSASSALIVGAGPVGLTSAIELRRFGVNVRIIEKLPHRSEKSKALAIWPRTLELWDRAGVTGPLLSAGLKAHGACLFSGEKQFGEISLDHVASEHQYVLLITQDQTERVLEEHLAYLGVTVQRNVELLSFTEIGDGISATLRSSDGATEAIDFGWLIGCDGAHSSIRGALGKSFHGTTVPTDFILADVHLSGSTEIAKDRISMFAHEEGFLQLYPIGGDRFRVIVDLGTATSDHRPDPTLEEVQTVIDRRGPGGITAHDPIWLSSFRINEREVEDYRSGRVFLAGDAAHIHSPAGGQGMNTGMQDAFNLAWKLALVARGACPDDLLTSYSAERQPVARQMIAETSKLTTLLTMKNPTFQSIRNHVAGFLLGIPGFQHALADKLSEITVGYPHSPLSRSATGSLPTPPPGSRAPLQGPSSASNDPRLMLHADDDDEAQQFLVEHQPLIQQTAYAPFEKKYMWLVRPDGYVAIVADAGDWNAMRSYLNFIAGSGRTTRSATLGQAAG
jgi:2-polyprenyl-6-methoxyphenol hydroxylase-like FAD-dependent oxidoreductase